MPSLCCFIFWVLLFIWVHFIPFSMSAFVPHFLPWHSSFSCMTCCHPLVILPTRHCCHPLVIPLLSPTQISECEGSAPAWVSDTNHPQYAAARTATQVVYGQDPDLTREGGSIPITITLQVRCLRQLTTQRPFAATVKGTDPKFYSKIEKKFFLLKKHSQVWGRCVPKY